MIKMFK